MSQSAELLDQTWTTLRNQVEDQLRDYLRLDDDCPGQLRDAMAYSLLGGGKRLRPVLVLLSCEACGGQTADALPAACAIEMIHTYSLIHDDLPAMDDDALRRGRPSCHVQFDEATAILAGDALLTLAFQVVARDIHPAQVAAACTADLAEAAGAVGMVGGQVADLEAEHQGHATLEQLEAVHRRKTGRLLCSALTLGARIADARKAGAAVETLEIMTEYGKSVGLAFQIADDLLDQTGEEAKMGKKVRKDTGKLTYPSLLGVQASRRRAEELIGQACRAIAPLGERGRRLEALAHFVLERDH